MRQRHKFCFGNEETTVFSVERARNFQRSPGGNCKQTKTHGKHHQLKKSVQNKSICFIIGLAGRGSLLSVV